MDDPMQFLALVYVDNEMLEALPAGEPDAMMRTCLRHADELQADGKLVGYQQLEDANTAKSVRIRSGRTRVVEGPFAETKEIPGGFTLIEAADMDEAVRITSEFPWASTGRDRQRVVTGRSGSAR